MISHDSDRNPRHGIIYEELSDRAYREMDELFKESPTESPETDEIGCRVVRGGLTIVAAVWRPSNSDHGFHLLGIVDVEDSDEWVDGFRVIFEEKEATIQYEHVDNQTEEIEERWARLTALGIQTLTTLIKDYFRDRE